MSTPTEIPLLDSIDMEVLMHKDAHFSGSFPIMLEYYRQDHVGVMPDFELSRIEYLAHIEAEQRINLSAELLPEAAKSVIKKAQTLYTELREVYEKQTSSPVSILLSDLILTEKDIPHQEIDTLVAQQDVAVDPLISLVSATTFYDPINPGYGRAPIFAADCLSKIGNTKAIPPLFEALGYDNFYTDEAMISALVRLNAPAKDFLLQILMGKKVSKDTEMAAMVLANFPLDDEISRIALNTLETMPEVWVHENLASYLICICEGLAKEGDRQRFCQLTCSPSLPSPLSNEIMIISRSWI